MPGELLLARKQGNKHLLSKSNQLSWKKKKGHFLTRQSLEQSNTTDRTQIKEDYFQVVLAIL